MSSRTFAAAITVLASGAISSGKNLAAPRTDKCESMTRKIVQEYGNPRVK